VTISGELILQDGKDASIRSDLRGVVFLAPKTAQTPPDSSTKSPQPKDASTDAGFQADITPCLWRSGIRGTVESRNEAAPVCASFGDICIGLLVRATGRQDVK